MRLAPSRAIPLFLVLAAFFGFAAIAHAQPGNVAVFNNPDYIDTTSGGFAAEGPNTVASLQSFGENVTEFTDISAAGFTAALAGKDSLVIPEEEHSCLDDSIEDDAKAVIRNFVASGGQLVVMAVGEDGCNGDLVNDIFSLSLVTSDEADSPSKLLTRGDVVFTKTAAAVGTEFQDGPDSIPYNNATGIVVEDSLPSNGKSIYSDGQGDAAVTDIPYGDGSITTLGWDWYDSTPPDPNPGTQPGGLFAARQTRGGGGSGQDYGWQDVLRSSVDLPVLNISDVSAPEGNSGTTPFGFTVTASQNHSEVLHVNYGTANGTATAGSDYTATGGDLAIARTDNAIGVNVPVIGDTTVEPNETFSLGIAPGATPATYAISKGTGTGTILNDDVNVAKPKVGVAGVRRACVSSGTVHVRFSITAPAGIKSVTISLDGKRVARSTKGRFTVAVKTSKLKSGRHTLTAVAIDNRGQKTTVRKTIARCAAAKPKRQTGPRFTG